MAWIQSYQDLGRHPKTGRLARTLGISRPAAIGHLHLLWWWALDYAKDGDLAAYDAGEIADACMWDQDADAFVEALVASGWLDADASGEHWRIHSWHEHGGRIEAERARNNAASAERMRRRRGEQAPNGQPVSAEPHGAFSPGSPPVTPEHPANTARVTALEKRREEQKRENERREEQQQSRTRPARTAAAAAAAGPGSEGYREELAPLTERMKAALDAAGIDIDAFTADAVIDYASRHGETGAEDFERACREASENNARRFSYLRTILDRCAAARSDGHDPWESAPAAPESFEAQRERFLGGPLGHIAQSGPRPAPLNEAARRDLQCEWEAAVRRTPLVEGNKIVLLAGQVVALDGNTFVVEVPTGTRAAQLQPQFELPLRRALSSDETGARRVRFIDPAPSEPVPTGGHG